MDKVDQVGGVLSAQANTLASAQAAWAETNYNTTTTMTIKSYPYQVTITISHMAYYITNRTNSLPVLALTRKPALQVATQNIISRRYHHHCKTRTAVSPPWPAAPVSSR